MDRKRKLETEYVTLSKDKCVGDLKDCRYAFRKSLPAKQRKLETCTLQTDSDGDILLDSTQNPIIRHYELLQKIASGGFGTVVRARDIVEDKIVAVKIIENTIDSHTDAVKEALTLRKIIELDPKDEHHCARLINSFCYHGHVCLVFDEYGPTVGKFSQWVRSTPSYTLEEIRHIGYQICCAIRFLHALKMTHNDIKPDNVVFVNKALSADSSINKDNFDVRLIDFGSVINQGLRINQGLTKQAQNVGRTRYYSSPEYLLKNQSDYGYDVWSIGCTLFEMYKGEMLFASASQIEHLALIQQICGKFPSSLATVQQNTFKADGTVKIDGRTKVARKVRSRLVLQNYKMSNTSSENAFFELLKRLLAINPDERMNMKDVLEMEFLRDYAAELKSNVESSNTKDSGIASCPEENKASQVPLLAGSANEYKEPKHLSVGECADQNRVASGSTAGIKVHESIKSNDSNGFVDLNANLGCENENTSKEPKHLSVGEYEDQNNYARGSVAGGRVHESRKSNHSNSGADENAITEPPSAGHCSCS